MKRAKGTVMGKLGYRPDEAADVLGSSELLAECEAAGWIKPAVRRTKLTIYDYSELVKCWVRICRGELPPARARKKTLETTAS